MKKIAAIPLLLLTFCFTAVYSQTTLPESDFQFWNETQLIFPIAKKTDKNEKKTDRLNFFIVGNLRFGQNWKHFVDERAGFGFDFKLNRNVTLSTSYLYRAGQPYRNRKEFENRLRFYITLEKKFENFSVKDRNMIEYRSRHFRANSTRYRNKLSFSYPVKNENKEIFSPFVANEVFYDLTEKEFIRNEFSAGITKKFNSSASADFFYLWQRNKGLVLRNVNALGINLKFRMYK